MEINNKFYFSDSIQIIKIFFYRVNFWMKVSSWEFPYSIEVISWKIGPIISIKHTIYIDHRKNMVIKRFFWVVILIIFYQKFYDSLKNKWALTLSRMLTRHEDYWFWELIVIVSLIFLLKWIDITTMEVLKGNHRPLGVDMVHEDRQTT